MKLIWLHLPRLRIILCIARRGNVVDVEHAALFCERN